MVYWSQYFSRLYKRVVLSAWLLHSAVESTSRHCSINIGYYLFANNPVSSPVLLLITNLDDLLDLQRKPKCFFQVLLFTLEKTSHGFELLFNQLPVGEFRYPG